MKHIAGGTNPVGQHYVFFDCDDPEDGQMFRDMREWCQTNLDPKCYRYSKSMDGGLLRFWFRNLNEAVAFRLTFSAK